MKGSRLKISIIIGLVFIIALVGTYFYAASKISPDEIRKLALNQIQQTFPNSEVNLGQIKLKFGTSIVLEVENLKISRPNSTLLDVGTFYINIPILSVITGSGRVDLKIKSPLVNYIEKDGSSNWALAMKKQESSVTKENKGASASFAIPAVLANTKINFDISQISLNYSLKNKDEGNIKLSKFLIKNLNIKEPTAFEIHSDINLKKDKKDFVSLELLSIGEVHLDKLAKGDDLFAHIMITLNRVKLDGIKNIISEIKSNIKLTQKGENLFGDFELKMGDSLKLNSKYKLNNGDFELDGLSGQIIVGELINLVGQNSPEGIDLTKSIINLNGNFSALKNGRMVPNVNFSLSPGISFNFKELKGDYSLEGSLKGKRLNVNGKGSVLNGEIKNQVNGEFDINDKNFSVATMAPMTIGLWIKGVHLTKDMIRKNIYAETKKQEPVKETNSENKTVAKTEQVSNIPLLPNARLDMYFDKVKVDANDFTGKARVLISPRSIITKNFDFNFSEGKGSIDQTTTFSKNSMNTNLMFKLSNLNMGGLKVFLPDMLKSIEGIFNGNVKGSVTSIGDNLKHDLDVDVRAYNGKIEGLEVEEKLNSLVENIPYLKDKKPKLPKKVDGEFKTFFLKGRFQENKYELKSFKFVGPENTMEFQGDGNLYPLPKSRKGRIDLDFIDKTGKISSLLKKQANTEILPIRLEGPQFNLMPDYEYTIKKLAKGALKAKANTAKTKAKEELKKKIEEKAGDLLKNKDVKKLFKGFFGK